MEVRKLDAATLWRWAQARGRGLPTDIGFELTSRCNFRCRHCFFSDCEEAEFKGELSAQEIIDIVDQIRADGGGWKMTLTGGECLLRSDFLQIYSHIYRTGSKVIVMTNGSLISESMVRVWEQQKPEYVSVTIYGATPSTYEALTGDGNNFHKVMRGIKRVVAAGVRVDLKTMVTTLNVGELDAIRALAAEISPNSIVRFDPLVRPTRLGSPAVLAYRLTARDAAEVAKKYYGSEKNCKEFRNIIITRNEALLEKGMLDDRVFGCNVSERGCWIAANGSMHYCVNLELPRYDLRKGTVVEGIAQIRKMANCRLTNDSPCLTCAYRPMCSSCPASGLSESADLAKPCLHMCEYTKLFGQHLGLTELVEAYSEQFRRLLHKRLQS